MPTTHMNYIFANVELEKKSELVVTYKSRILHNM